MIALQSGAPLGNRSITEAPMTANPTPEGHVLSLGSPYCSDPNCEYCKELRKAEEQLSKEYQRNLKSHRGAS